MSGSKNLISVLDLGHQALTGVFPRPGDPEVPRGPLELLWCPDSGLLQLANSCDPKDMYGENYGYRSGLNQSMIDHLTSKADHLARMVSLSAGDLIVDIGSNDATLLKAYKAPGLKKLGIDPTGSKFREFYPADTELVPDFFSRGRFVSAAGNKKAKIITSIAMFYDLEDPVAFARDVHDCLSDDGIWHFEQSYLPSMLRLNSYDTVCHEHVEYYSLTAVMAILERAGLEATNVVMNMINGGSFAVTASKVRSSERREKQPAVQWLLGHELRSGLGTPRPFRDFEERVFEHRHSLRALIHALVSSGKKILGYGASTKGNVLLQFCGLTVNEIPSIADVNPDKFGRVTPGTNIPIVSEQEARAMSPDYFLVLPWHFKHGILRRESEFLARGGQMIFPMPEIEIV
ncbi:MAG: class I SAM-dependent methyltransferase [Myxococcaceae bacterium]